jgi:four helix bundle protein
VPGDFVDLLVWQKATTLVAALSSELRQLRGTGAHSARDQMIRAAESIPANIAEGYGRGITGVRLRITR